MRQFQNTTISKHFILALLAIMTSAITSCSRTTPVIIQDGPHIKVDVPLTKKFADKIIPFTTTKKEILDQLGPPTAIARKGKVMTFPPPGRLKAGFIEMNSETFFEPFSLKFNNTDGHIIYYYHRPILYRVESKLWLYINQTNGIVEDYLFIGSGSMNSTMKKETKKDKKTKRKKGNWKGRD